MAHQVKTNFLVAMTQRPTRFALRSGAGKAVIKMNGSVEPN